MRNLSMENKNLTEASYRELLLGCGSNWEKRVKLDGTTPDTFQNLTTLDYNPSHEPHIGFDINDAFQRRELLPFASESFDEIHAYEVLEHLGSQGDYRFFFHEFEEYWRILKPGGFFCATVPTPISEWAFGDPSHTRIFHPYWITFLDQDSYAQVGKTAMSDFRHIYSANFKLITHDVTEDENTYIFVLQKKERKVWEKV
jgi:SAM-dependent methyltransferase